MDPKNGTGNFIFKSDGPLKICEYAEPWIKGFGVKVELGVMLTEEEFVKIAKELCLFLD